MSDPEPGLDEAETRRRRRRCDALLIPAVVAAALCAVLWSSANGPGVLLIGAFHDTQLAVLSAAAAVLLVGAWVVGRSWISPITRNWAGYLWAMAVTWAVVACWLYLGWFLLWIFAWSGFHTYHRFDVPGSDQEYLVGVSSGLGDANIRILRGGPWRFVEVSSSPYFDDTMRVAGLVAQGDFDPVVDVDRVYLTFPGSDMDVVTIPISPE